MQDAGGMLFQRPQIRAAPWKESSSPVHSQPSYTVSEGLPRAVLTQVTI